MSYRLLSGLWLSLPYRVRRFFIRATYPTFTVSAAAVIVNDEGKVLLLHHLMRPSGGWGLPGGFLDQGEQPEAAVRRELREETGIELHDLKVVHFRTIGGHIEVMYSARTNDEPRVLSSEIDELGWFSPDDMPDNLQSDQRRTAERVLKAEI